MSDKLKLNFSNWKIKKEEKGRGRMKLSIKLGKEESESLKNWMSAVKPDEVAEDVFFKHIFFTGVNVLNQQLTELAEKEIAKQQLEAQKKAALAETSGEQPVTPDPSPLTLVK